jgi:hypothetical protein
VICIHSQLFVGLTTPSKFKKGYGLRGYMYGGPGNLADGSALLKGHWGPEFKSGDKVGILANAGADKLDVCGVLFLLFSKGKNRTLVALSRCCGRILRWFQARILILDVR